MVTVKASTGTLRDQATVTSVTPGLRTGNNTATNENHFAASGVNRLRSISRDENGRPGHPRPAMRARRASRA
jgi:hypothetical protein